MLGGGGGLGPPKFFLRWAFRIIGGPGPPKGGGACITMPVGDYTLVREGCGQKENEGAVDLDCLLNCLRVTLLEVSSFCLTLP